MEPGYIKCKYCNNGKLILDNDYVKITYCKVCGGSGKIDWIENIVGHHIEISNDKWYNVSINFDGYKLYYYHNNIKINKNKFIADVKLKNNSKKFNISFWINLNGQVDNFSGCIGGSV